MGGVWRSGPSLVLNTDAENLYVELQPSQTDSEEVFLNVRMLW